MPVKAVEVILSDQAEAALEALGKDKKTAIVKRIKFYEADLKRDCQAGTVIPCPVPKKAKPLESRHGKLENLFKCELPDFWRLLYTIVRVDNQPYVYILEIISHPDYDKWF